MIPHNLPTIGNEEEVAALRVLRSKQLSQNIEVELFENEFCDYLGLPHGSAVALSNGTSALFLALEILGAKERKILFPGYVCSALRNAVSMTGGIEDIVDVEINSPNVNTKMIKCNSPHIAIIPHMYGIPIQIEINDSLIIEDCCQALGAKINNKMVGLQGDVGIFSFYATKLMTSGGQGGMFISKNQKYVNAVRDYREFDYRKDSKNRFNFKMTDLQAAIGRVQLKKLPYFLKRREEIFNKYKNSCDFKFLDIDPKDKEKIKPVRYRAIIKTKNPKDIINSLYSKGIKAIIPTEDWELLGNLNSIPNSLKLSKESVSIPLYPSLTDDDVEKIILALNSCI